MKIIVVYQYPDREMHALPIIFWQRKADAWPLLFCRCHFILGRKWRYRANRLCKFASRSERGRSINVQNLFKSTVRSHLSNVSKVEMNWSKNPASTRQLPMMPSFFLCCPYSGIRGLHHRLHALAVMYNWRAASCLIIFSVNGKLSTIANWSKVSSFTKMLTGLSISKLKEDSLPSGNVTISQSLRGFQDLESVYTLFLDRATKLEIVHSLDINLRRVHGWYV
jgi:hypothetical protein